MNLNNTLMLYTIHVEDDIFRLRVGHRFRLSWRPTEPRCNHDELEALYVHLLQFDTSWPDQPLSRQFLRLNLPGSESIRQRSVFASNDTAAKMIELTSNDLPSISVILFLDATIFMWSLELVISLLHTVRMDSLIHWWFSPSKEAKRSSRRISRRIPGIRPGTRHFPCAYLSTRVEVGWLIIFDRPNVQEATNISLTVLHSPFALKPKYPITSATSITIKSLLDQQVENSGADGLSSCFAMLIESNRSR
jgi:hypothetical protein